MEANTATERQIKLIEDLYADLRIRDTSLYGGAMPAQLTKQRASEVIDVLMLRKLSSQLYRPVTADLTDPAQVREQLSRLEQLTDGHHTRHATETAKRADHLRKASRISDESERQSQAAAVPRVRTLPHLRDRQQAQPRELSQEQLAARAAGLDREKDARLDAANHYTDVTGYGSSASYQADVRPASDAPQLTDRQERKIIELQDAGGDESVMDTITEANEYINRALARPQPPTERQLAYLHKLEREAGKTQEQLSHPATRQGASRRIQLYVDAAARRETTSDDEDLTASVALTGAASPHTIREVATAASAVTTRSRKMLWTETSTDHHLGTHKDVAAPDGR